jgi:hypothetical protein
VQVPDNGDKHGRSASRRLCGTDVAGDRFVVFLENELIPHALTEEKAIKPLGRKHQSVSRIHV